MSDLDLRGMSAAENEFLAEETLIRIVPNFTHPILYFISVSNILEYILDIVTVQPLMNREILVHLMSMSMLRFLYGSL